MMTFEEMQEKCVENKEKVNKWSKVLTVVLMASMIYLFHNHGNTIVCEIIFVTSGIILFSNLVFTYKKVLSDRIYSKFPAELGAELIIIMIAWMVTDISNFREVMKVYDLREVIFLLFEIWLICFLTHCLSIRLLDFTFFSNPTVKYTGKIVEFEKGIISNYACFYDFTNELNKVLISAEEYKNLSVGDVIDTVLQVRIDKIEVKKISRIRKIKGLTDMEIDRIKHQRDVELFGQSQEEKDAASGKSKELSYKWAFIIPGVLITFLYFAYREELNSLMASHEDLYIGIGIISLTLTGVVSYFEYKRLKEEYSKKDIQIWFDYLAPRILLYSFTIYAVIGVILSIYDQTNEKYVERDGTVKRFVKKENNLTTYIVEYKDEDGSLDSLEIWTWKDVDKKEGDSEKVKYRLGGLGRKSNFH